MTAGAAATELSGSTEAIDGMELSVDREVIVAAMRQRDRLDARLAAAVAAFDAAELWDLDGSTSMTRWLVAECRMSDGAARRLVRTAGRSAELPVLAAASADGTLSAGQVEVITSRVGPRHVGLFAEHGAALIPTWALLDLETTAAVVRNWAEKADAVLDDDEPTEHELSRLHHNEVGDRGRLDSDLAGDDDALVAEALRLAGRRDDESDERRRTRAERDADALVDICRRILRDHETPKTAPGRQRPGINVGIDAADLAALELRDLGIGTIAELDAFLHGRSTTTTQRAWYRAGLSRRLGPGGGSASTLSGHDLSPSLAGAFCCDSTMRRVISADSTILDYGRPMPTLPRSVRDAVVLRDRRGRFRGCNRTVDWGEVHHLRHREDGGADAVTNCVLLCARHHHVLHRDGWSAELDLDGTFTVTDPRGWRWTTRPPGPGNGPSPPELTYGA